MKRYSRHAMVFALAVLGTVSLALAGNRTAEKAREAVEEASPDDWYTLAANAEKCFKKQVNLREAAAWLDASLAIAQMPYNLTLKGDYYIMNKLPEEALTYYVKAIEALHEKPDTHITVDLVQRKIAEIKDMPE